MAFDGIMLYAVTHELRRKILGAKINRVFQPKEDEIIIFLRSRDGEIKLLISANSNNCRLNITTANVQNPKTPPMFCMLLRKHLVGGRVQEVLQHGLDRIVEFIIHNNDEFMRPVKYRLVVEIMGRHSNIILVEDPTGIIADSIKRVPSHINRFRQILPGYDYVPPPLVRKASILSKDDIRRISKDLHTIKTDDNTITVSKWLLDNIMGIDGITSREICLRSSVDPRKSARQLSSYEKDRITDVLKDLANQIQNARFKPTICRMEKLQDVIGFWVLPMELCPGRQEVYDSANRVVDIFFERKYNASAVMAAAKSIRIPIKKLLAKTKQSSDYCKIRLSDATNKDIFRLWGEVLSANIYRIAPGSEKVVLPNFYDDDSDIEIKLNPRLSPSQNAQHYFKQYRKLKATQIMTEKRKKNYRKEIDYLENVLLSLDNCETMSDVFDIRKELEALKYLRPNKKSVLVPTSSKPLKFVTGEGFDVLVGKNNRQNDLLTFKSAHPNDLWFHAKDIPGSHVVLLCHEQSPNQKTLEEVAILASYFSKAKTGSNVPVDFTLVKNVKKPRGSKPGFVNYTHQKTLFVTPDSDTVKKMSL